MTNSSEKSLSKASRKAKAFLEKAHEFKLGNLPTETPHKDTTRLSEYAMGDILKGISVFKKIDMAVIKTLKKHVKEIEELSEDIRDTIASENRIFLGGCGSTGRLSLTLETLWREKYGNDTVVSFMAGGDIAIIKAVENFEDYPKYGARQLTDLEFGRGDLFIGITEGGETPFVIGATEKAAEISERSPYFVYCNPDTILCKEIKRSEQVIKNHSILKINLTVGSMALSGSTRLQACTIQMYAVGLALFAAVEDFSIREEIDKFMKFLDRTDYSFFQKFILEESDIYSNGGYLLYETPDFAITVLTDTTERAPTFSLVPFENQLDEEPVPALSYLCVPTTRTPEEAWRQLFKRPPRVLKWGIKGQAVNLKWLMGFDFSKNIRNIRKKMIPRARHETFRIEREANTLHFSLAGLNNEVSIRDLSLLQVHLFLKIVLNMHSTLVMGRIGRYENNIMTWVRPSNNKLIDRTIRYVSHMLLAEGIRNVTYEEIAYACFDVMETLADDEPVVLRVFEKIKSGNKSG